jgi:hypothetical protein
MSCRHKITYKFLFSAVLHIRIFRLSRNILKQVIYRLKICQRAFHGPTPTGLSFAPTSEV